MPLLWQEFRRFGWTKLRVIANISTIETQEFWLDKLRKTPTLVLREYVRKWNENSRAGVGENIDLFQRFL